MTRSTWGEPKASVMNIVNWEGMRGVSTGMITTPPRPCMNLLSQNPLFLVLNLPKEPLVEAGFESSIWHPVKPERHLKRVREQMDWATQKFSHTNAFDQSLKHTHMYIYIWYMYDICMIYVWYLCVYVCFIWLVQSYHFCSICQTLGIPNWWAPCIPPSSHGVSSAGRNSPAWPVGPAPYRRWSRDDFYWNVYNLG